MHSTRFVRWRRVVASQPGAGSESVRRAAGRSRSGHGAGLRNHEAPFLDLGDGTPVQPGMVFTIEPGVYDREVGGLRHSDTIAVTEDGIEVLTDYPRDLESLTIPA